MSVTLAQASRIMRDPGAAPVGEPIQGANFDAYQCGFCGARYLFSDGREHKCPDVIEAPKASERPYKWLGCVANDHRIPHV